MRRAGYPVPRLESFATAAASPWHRPFLVVEWVEGAPLSGSFWNRDPARRTVLQLMSRLHALECLPTLDSSEPSDWPTDEYRSAYCWATRAIGSLPAHGPCLVHGDFHGGNVLIATAGPVVIDWSNGSLGDPRHDLAWIRLLTVARSEPDVCQRELQWYEASNLGLDELLPFEVVGAIKILSTISLLRSGRSAVLHAQAASRTDPRFVDYLLKLVRSATGEDVPSPL